MQVWIKTAFCGIQRVAAMIANQGSFSAYITYSGHHSPSIISFLYAKKFNPLILTSLFYGRVYYQIRSVIQASRYATIALANALPA
jgi:hypothetical protein